MNSGCGWLTFVFIYCQVIATYDYNTHTAKLSVKGVEDTWPFNEAIEIHTLGDLIFGGVEDQPFVGELSCVLVYDRILTDDEMAGLATCPHGKSDRLTFHRIFKKKYPFVHNFFDVFYVPM